MKDHSREGPRPVIVFPTVMHCLARRRMKHTVSAFLDGELEPSVMAKVEAHLRRCWECSSDYELGRLVKSSLRNLATRDRDALAAMRLRRFAARLGRRGTGGRPGPRGRAS
ncbi:MAG: hypothetical protein GEV08_01985 [Acidimicrobiia bacterium]|nr:hypothetical protein [Acidimicrobiia bacterium]